jgi:hypothetical protein
MDWMKRHLPAATKFQDVTGLPQLAQCGYSVLSVPCPVDSGAKTSLSRDTYSLFATETSVLVCVLNVHVFPSSGHVPLLLSLRKSLGETRTLEQASGHLFEKAEAADAVSIIVLAMQFFWDCLVIGATGETVFYISHDEYCDLLTTSQATINRFNSLATQVQRPKT